MKNICICLCFIFLAVGCASLGVMTTTTIKLDNPVALEATKNYLPPDVMEQPAYTIYEGSKWDCKYTTENHDYVCCSREPFSTMSPWKYCLILDSEYRAFGYFELGSSQYKAWSTGKQQLFKKIAN